MTGAIMIINSFTNPQDTHHKLTFLPRLHNIQGHMDETYYYLLGTRDLLGTFLQRQWNADQEHWRSHPMYSRNLKQQEHSRAWDCMCLFCACMWLCFVQVMLKHWARYWPTSLTLPSDSITTSCLTVRTTRTLCALTLIGQTCPVTNSAYGTGLCIISSSFGTVESCRAWVR